MVISVASVLSFTSESLKDLQNANIKKEKMQSILSTVGINVSRDESEQLYNEYISEELSLRSDGSVDNEVDAFDINLALEVKKDNDIQSGQGYVHNSLLFESPQKGVLYSKFRLSPIIDPPWFVTNKKAHRIFKNLTYYQATNSKINLIKLIFSTLI